MSHLDRILVIIVSILLLVSAVLIGLSTWGNQLLLSWLFALPQNKFDGILLILILGLLAVYLVLMAVNQVKVDQRSLVRVNELGDIRISAQSIIGLINKATNDIEGIKDVNVNLTEVEPLKVIIELQLLPDFHIPELTESVQSNIKEYLQTTVGVEIDSIGVIVNGIAPQQKTRVQ